MANSQNATQKRRCGGPERSLAALIHPALVDVAAALILNTQQVRFAPGVHYTTQHQRTHPNPLSPKYCML